MGKPLTREEWLTYLDTTWKKCLADAWQKDWDDMTKEDIIAMARRAGAHDDGFEVRFVELRYLERFAALIRADEREACAKVCDEMEQKAEGTECCKWPTPADCAHAIRARGQAKDEMPLFDDWDKDWK
jgi:hypothetical protein